LDFPRICPTLASIIGDSVKRLAVLAALALLFSVAVVPTVDAEPRGKTLISSKIGSRAKPSTLYYGGADFRLPGINYVAKGLRWRGWGRGRARARGQIRVCPNMRSCRRFPVKVLASGLARRAEGTSNNVYSYVRFTRRGRSRPLLKLCVYAEACRIGPVG
jgi:hypothetical protein